MAHFATLLASLAIMETALCAGKTALQVNTPAELFAPIQLMVVQHQCKL